MHASYYAQISPDGSYVVFVSYANNLVPGDTNSSRDIFLKNLVTGAITRISTTAAGEQAGSGSSAPHISTDGRYVVFESAASNLVPGDTNNAEDVFRKDLVTGAITRISTTANGEQAEGGSTYSPRFSTDGRYVVFESAASNLVPGDTNNQVDIFRKDLVTGAITRISTTATGEQAEGGISYNHEISTDGRYVVFASEANNLVPGDTNSSRDIFLKNLVTGAITRISTTAAGEQAGSGSSAPHISTDGRYVVFESAASNLVPGDTNNAEDVFRKDLVTGAITRISTTATGEQAEGNGSFNAQISADGHFVVFTSQAGNLVPGDTNGENDIFLVDLRYHPYAAAIAEGRYVETTLAVGAAFSVTVDWGDGSSVNLTPSGGMAFFSHTYATAGAKAATVTVYEGAQSWTVPYTIDLASGTMNRNVFLSDTLSGGAGDDILTGDALSNTLMGRDGNDRLDGGAGIDIMLGGGGNDTYVIDTRQDQVTEAANAGIDTVLTSMSLTLTANVENLTATGPAGVTLTGNSLHNTLTGNRGADKLSASSGNDRLVGGLGKDSLTGGSGRDTFAFDDRETGSSKSKADYILDFSRRQGDKIDLKAIDANTRKRGDQKFSFIGDEKSFSKAGEVRFEKTKSATYIYLNTDNDRSAEAVIKLKGAIELQKSWFVL
ncbi:Ca2+-binding RTX toxin-like protein [Microvirga lupini]|uniref:Ca2+-binding RTX toxin-like protein n=1 Tax=Microvirga lupini TaxID=420324 RepID=A0A7W4VJT4_9HYPH|nr:calcium-binding protein [Microvirga lupini]MBB3017927.1 Ca2+-binding RTX toxin-like protein [Microvirga lupini]